MRKILCALPALLMTLLVMCNAASANSSWLPPFDPGRFVFAGPGVEVEMREVFNKSDFQAKLFRSAAVNDLDVYVVLTKTPPDAGGDTSQTGPVLVRRLWDSWSVLPRFKKERALVILLTGDGHSFNSVGVRAGDFLNRLGIVRKTMSDENGPVIPVLRAHLDGEPSVVPVGIVDNINNIVAAKISWVAPVAGGDIKTLPVTPPVAAPTKKGKSMFENGWLITMIIVGICAVIVFGRPRSSRRASGGQCQPGASDVPTSSFPERLSASRRDRDNGMSDNHAKNDQSISGVGSAAALGAGVIGGAILAETMRNSGADEAARRRRDEESRSSDSTGIYTPSCSTAPSSPPQLPKLQRSSLQLQQRRLQLWWWRWWMRRRRRLRRRLSRLPLQPVNGIETPLRSIDRRRP